MVVTKGRRDYRVPSKSPFNDARDVILTSRNDVSQLDDDDDDDEPTLGVYMMSITSKRQATLHNTDDHETSTLIITPYLGCDHSITGVFVCYSGHHFLSGHEVEAEPQGPVAF